MELRSFVFVTPYTHPSSGFKDLAEVRFSYRRGYANVGFPDGLATRKASGNPTMEARQDNTAHQAGLTGLGERYYPSITHYPLPTRPRSLPNVNYPNKYGNNRTEATLEDI